MTTKFASLSEARSGLQQLDLSTLTLRGTWSVGQVLTHCAQSIEYSLTGFPQNKPWIVRATVGPLVLGKFLRQGFMKHDVQAPIPGAPDLDATDPKKGLQRLLEAIEGFEAHAGPFAVHFVYGPVDKISYDRIQAMHIADHFSR